MLISVGHQKLLAQGAPPNAVYYTDHFKSPAERLGLTGKARARAERCLADAIYFEARGESLRGQKAVAQVVINRAFSGRYPHDICGVVYQNSWRHLACQFTFACTGRALNRNSEPRMWQRAQHIATDALDGNIWLAEVGHATHYHASWVRPLWIREMAKLYRVGVHTFYRPRAWGNGSDAPVLSALAVRTRAALAPSSKSKPAGETTAAVEIKPASTDAKSAKPAGAADAKSAADEPKSTGSLETRFAAPTKP